MPSIRKRIGYLPSVNIQDIITNIAKKEKLSQSKVVGILVEEALIARGIFNLKGTNSYIRKNGYSNQSQMNNSFANYNDLDELISDKGITYNPRKIKDQSNNFSSKYIDAHNEDLFEQFKQFILFQKMIEEKQ